LDEQLTVLLQAVEEDLFLRAYLLDLVNRIRHNQDRDRVMRLLETVSQRMSHYHHWQGSGINQTRMMIEQGGIKLEAIKPHICFSDEEYSRFYARQNAEMSQRLAGN
jgi:hypothetical protein